MSTRENAPLPDVGSKRFGSGAPSTAIRQNAEAKLTFGNRESGPARAGIPAGTREGVALDHGQEHPGGGETRSPEHLRHERLVAVLREVAEWMGKVKAAEALGVSYRTLARAVESGRLARVEAHQVPANGSRGASAPSVKGASDGVSEPPRVKRPIRA